MREIRPARGGGAGGRYGSVPISVGSRVVGELAPWIAKIKRIVA